MTKHYRMGMVYVEIEKINAGRGITKYKGWVYEVEIATALNIRLWRYRDNPNEYLVIPTNTIDTMRVWVEDKDQQSNHLQPEVAVSM